jgi:hypothetical protein
MAPETAQLIEKIAAERVRISDLIEQGTEELKESDEQSEEIARESAASDAETEVARQTLRRAGLLPA